MRLAEPFTALLLGAGALASGFAVAGAAGFGLGTLSALASLAAATGLLLWLSDDAPVTDLAPWAWGLAASTVVALGSAAEYGLWFVDSRWWSVVCHLAALALVATAGLKRGWVGGLKAALVGHLVATSALLVLFLAFRGQPVQTAVLQSNGTLDSYAITGGADFATWVAQAQLAAVLPRTVAALLLGAGLGAAASFLRPRLRPGRRPPGTSPE